MFADKSPVWARRLVDRISSDYTVHSPFIVWTHRKGKESTGYCTIGGQSIGIRTGSDKADARYTILHEMAHLILILTSDYDGIHDDTFYNFLWPLLRRYRSPIKKALEYESEHHRRTVERTYRLGGGRIKIQKKGEIVW